MFEFDHVHSPASLGTRPLAVLYGELGTDEFEVFHDVLSSLSASGRLVYVMRHYIKVSRPIFPPSPPPPPPIYHYDYLMSTRRGVLLPTLFSLAMAYSSLSRVQSTKPSTTLKFKVQLLPWKWVVDDVVLL